MNSRRAKVTATATVLGLGGLAAVAMESNHGLPVGATGIASSGIVTHTSGAATNAGPTAPGAERAPIVTRASGGAAGTVAPVDD